VIYREFASLDAHVRMPDESTILRLRHRLEKHKLAEQILATVSDLLAAQGLLLKAGTAVDATLIAAPSSTKNKDRKRDPEMHSSQKGNEWHFGMKAHIGVDADSGLVHTVIGTSGNVADVVEGNSLLHGQETDGFGDASKTAAITSSENLGPVALTNQSCSGHPQGLSECSAERQRDQCSVWRVAISASADVLGTFDVLVAFAHTEPIVQAAYSGA
jgi:hypothetical protein